MLNYYNPVNVIKTENWHFELISNIKKLEIISPVIITSPGNRKRLKLDLIFPSKCIFSDVESNPNFENCINTIDFCKKDRYDGVVAIGGGSVMDLAKVVIAYLCLDKSNIFDLIEYEDQFPKTIPSIFLPTTHGTASEVTMWGTIWNMKEKKKYSISNPALYPSVAILDGNITMSLPLDISITTVMDALSHSFEAIWNKNANVTSTTHAIEAISLIMQNIEILKKNPHDKEVRSNLLWASNKAGLAFSNTKTAAAHSISYPLTIHHNIPHGIASSVSLIPLLKINRNFIKKSIDKICELNNFTFDQLVQFIKSIPGNYIHYQLKDWGISKNQLDGLAKESFTKGRMENNIVDLSVVDVNQILNSIYS